MPESKARKRTSRPQARARADRPNPIWFKPVMFGAMLLGLVWILTYYVTQAQWPIGGIGNWNMVIGFGLVIVGFIMTTRWRT